ncbi:hypothetical protein HU200_005192 [Digitaria exilis]|uniref:Cytochrome P450 n=1 Tax=Digitaria exilis TaxID=1010633 RepID=A0A835BHM4_9POAL|nr:hypothetical protein HU200_036078 [Digitaria exilis]KAF8697476.1 hypothetical protein HU200_036079 [Digitaria exilis]KAF8697477.1 hypothetical protein HU200_036080 [Digitaria exilis]KAF8772808.1 hypothetical protein HU200_005192 [Digitaria exilis]CAB3480951.1 unnamed protein product [Digitaria exilis]
MATPYVLAAAGALIVFLYVLVMNRRRRGKLPPSPPSVPLLGHLHLIGRLAHRSLHDLHLRYGGGNGLLLLQLGRRRTLVVCTAAAATDMFKNHDLAFASRPRSVGADKLMYGCDNVSFAPYGESWRRAKKIAVVHLLSPRRVESFAPVRAAEVAALVARTRLAAAEAAGEGVELRGLLYGYANAVVTRATAGVAGATAERLKQLMAKSAGFVAGFEPEDVLPDAPARFVRWVTGIDKKLGGIVRAWDMFLSELIAAHEEKTANVAEEDEGFLDVLLRLRRDGAEGLELTDNRIKAIVKDVIMAATETSSDTLEWTMAELVANPRVMGKLQDEIARVAAAGDGQLAESDLNKMGYLRAVLKEVLRLHPPAPLLVPHESTAPTVVQGYEIPAKTVLFVNVWAIGRDPAAWDAPEEFRPERFMFRDSGGAPVDFRGTDYQLVPFGAGRRICPGISFALPVLELALAGLLRHFDWELPAGVRPGDLDMGEAPGLTTPRRVPLVLVPKCKMLPQPALQQ